jgi:hypothetical protein
MEDVGNLYGHFSILWLFRTYLAIWYILWLFGIFVQFLVCCNEKNLATLPDSVTFGTVFF